MNKQLPQNQAIIKTIRIFLAQYLANVHNIKSFQNQALNILALYILSIIKKLAIQAKKITHMQGRSETNSLHLLAAVQIHSHFKLQQFAHFYQKYRQQMNHFPHMYFQKLYQDLFQNDIQNVNQYQKQTRFRNILYIRPHYTTEPMNNVLPIKASIQQSFEYPQQFNYKQTKNEIKRQKKNIQNLRIYTTRQVRKTMGMVFKDQNNKQEGMKVQPPVQKTQNKIKSFDIIGSL